MSVFVGFTLPRTLGVTEIDVDGGRDGEFCMRCDLRAAIPGQALLRRNRQLVHLSGKR